MFEGITHPQQRGFLAAYAECGVVLEAAKLACVTRQAHYEWLRIPEYQAAFHEARAAAADAIQDEVVRRALGRNGSHASDKLLCFLLERLMPDVYGKKVDHKITAKVEQKVNWSVFTDEELAQLEQLAQKSVRRS